METRYSKLEKLVYALLIVAWKLQPYFQVHTITLLTDQPIKSILHQPDTFECITKWTIKLFEFDIRFQPQPSIKAQILIDFLVECTIPDELQESKGSSQEQE